MFKVLKPKKGVKVHNPATKLFLPENGHEIKMSNYWWRRLKEKSVIDITSEKIPTNIKTNKKVNKTMEGKK